MCAPSLAFSGCYTEPCGRLQEGVYRGRNFDSIPDLFIQSIHSSSFPKLCRS